MSIELWTAATPNGWKISIMLEELIEAGVSLPEISVHTVQLMEGEQFSDTFTAINPNQKIPALVHDGRAIMESGAILQYLGETFPSDLMPLDARRWDVLPWLFWQVANLGPVFGNKLSYTRYLTDIPEIKREHPLERFNKEAQRLLSVLSNQLGAKDFVCGGNFTIADIAIYPWVRGWKWSKIDITGYDNIVAWVDRIRARPGVDRGLKYGIPDDEVDGWKKDTKDRYAKLGATMASNEKLRTNQ
ncbi:MAG: glutathione S-transferase N-terminal domain-containing protein [Pseudomonadota bacterium]